MFAACYQWIGLGLLALTSGCAMCNSCDDYTYGAYGGRWERLDPSYGRVGSAFTPEVGQRVDVDEHYAPEMHAVPNEGERQESSESTPAEPMPESTPAEESPAEGEPMSPMPSETDPFEGQMPAEDAAPQPPQPSVLPQTTSEQGKSLDASVLRRPVRPRR